jgi:alanine-glyoxylate transaminase/serine-glyoxylate transaminase/serine-pyruvate transaminase
MSTPILGYLDPEFIQIMDGVAEMLREVFGTADAFTLPVSGTGSAGMEAALANLLEPGDVAMVVENGYFGLRLSEIASRQGAEVLTVPVEWGQTASPEAVEAELKKHSNVKLLAAVHAETSTGVLQPLKDLGKLAHDNDALFLADTVTSLGGSPINFDDIDIDFAYSATQKCLGSPPGMAPVAIGPRALEVIKNRKEKPRTWYLDLGLLLQYWAGGTRVYHHTAPMSNIYALRESLRMVLEEGLENRFARHRKNGRALRAGLEALGLKLLVPEDRCTYQLTSVFVPDGIEDAPLRRRLLNEYKIEIGGGLGQFGGKMWRVGLMGESSTVPNVLALLSALETILPESGFEVAGGAGVAAASKSLAADS